MPDIPHTILEGHSLFVGDFKAFDRTRYGQISPRASPPSTRDGARNGYGREYEKSYTSHLKGTHYSWVTSRHLTILDTVKSLLAPLFPPPGTERGVDMIENMGRAKDPEIAKDE
jgi:hypothetical protein